VALLAIIMLMSLPGVTRAGNISITLSGAVVFVDDDPDLVPVLGPQTVQLDVKTVGRAGVPWSLTLEALTNLQSGPDVIPISAISWTAAPNPPFLDGTLSISVPTLVASGLTHDRSLVSFSFWMQNSWAYNAGNYSATALFTLAAP
jgi:hypothetical protein